MNGGADVEEGELPEEQAAPGQKEPLLLLPRGRPQLPPPRVLLPFPHGGGRPLLRGPPPPPLRGLPPPLMPLPPRFFRDGPRVITSPRGGGPSFRHDGPPPPPPPPPRQQDDAARAAAREEREREELTSALRELTRFTSVQDAMRSLDTVCADLKKGIKKLDKLLAKHKKKRTDDVAQFPECATFSRRILEGLRSVNVVVGTSIAHTHGMDAVLALFRAAMNYRHDVFSPAAKQELEGWVRTTKVLKVIIEEKEKGRNKGGSGAGGTGGAPGDVPAGTAVKEDEGAGAPLAADASAGGPATAPADQAQASPPPPSSDAPAQAPQPAEALPPPPPLPSTPPEAAVAASSPDLLVAAPPPPPPPPPDDPPDPPPLSPMSGVELPHGDGSAAMADDAATGGGPILVSTGSGATVVRPRAAAVASAGLFKLKIVVDSTPDDISKRPSQEQPGQGQGHGQGQEQLSPEQGPEAASPQQRPAPSASLMTIPVVEALTAEDPPQHPRSPVSRWGPSRAAQLPEAAAAGAPTFAASLPPVQSLHDLMDSPPQPRQQPNQGAPASPRPETAGGPELPPPPSMGHDGGGSKRGVGSPTSSGLGAAVKRQRVDGDRGVSSERSGRAGRDRERDRSKDRDRDRDRGDRGRDREARSERERDHDGGRGERDARDPSREGRHAVIGHRRRRRRFTSRTPSSSSRSRSRTQTPDRHRPPLAPPPPESPVSEAEHAPSYANGHAPHSGAAFAPRGGWGSIHKERERDRGTRFADRDTPSMLGLRERERDAREVVTEEARGVLRRGRLVLVIDLDHTLLNSVRFADLDTGTENLLAQRLSVEASMVPDPQRELFRSERLGIWTKLRPGAREFLARAAEKFELWVRSGGAKPYADAMAALLDPDDRFFEGRVIAAGGAVDGPDGMSALHNQRLLSALEALRPVALALDDSSAAWPGELGLALLGVERYLFFPEARRRFGLEGRTLLQINRDECPDRGMLLTMWHQLERLHSLVLGYLHHPGPAGQLLSAPPADPRLPPWDVRNVLHDERLKVLQGVRIAFSRVIPLDADPRSHPLWRMAEAFGAVCDVVCGDGTTHVVASARGTDKTLWAVQHGRPVVSPAWLECCCTLWRKANEDRFNVQV